MNQTHIQKGTIPVSSSGGSKKLLELRDRMDLLDMEIAELIIGRIELVEEINAVKNELGLSVYDPEREREIIKNVCGNYNDAEKAQVKNIFHRILDESRRFQAASELKSKDASEH